MAAAKWYSIPNLTRSRSAGHTLEWVPSLQRIVNNAAPRPGHNEHNPPQHPCGGFLLPESDG